MFMHKMHAVFVLIDIFLVYNYSFVAKAATLKNMKHKQDFTKIIFSDMDNFFYI